MRFAWPSPFEAGAAVCVAGAVQLAWGLVFAWRRSRDLLRPPAPEPPPATLLIPCAGRLEGLDACLDAFLAQDYGSGLEMLFVVPSEKDPAWDDLRRLKERRPQAKFEVIASGLAPERAGGKPQDIAYALRRASPASQVFLLTDVDLRVSPGWARSLASALEDPTVGVATAMTPFAGFRSLGGLTRTAWLAYGIPYLEWQRVPVGQSLAIRRSDYEELGLDGLWSRVLSEDMSLSRRILGWNKRLAFVGGAVAPSIDGMEDQGLFTVFNRWTALFRIYRPDVWLLGALFTALKVFAALLALRGPAYRHLPLAVFAWDAAYLWLVCAALGRPFAGLAAAAAAPLACGVYAVNFASTLVVRRVRWGPYEYRVTGAESVVARRIPR